MPMKIRLGSSVSVSFVRLTPPMAKPDSSWSGIQFRPSRSPATSIPATPAIPRALAFVIAWRPWEYMALRVSATGMFEGKRKESS